MERPAPTLSELKHALRTEIRARLTRLAPEERAAASRQARSLLEQQAVWRAANAVLFYAPLPEELDVWPLLGAALAAGKVVALPRYDAAANRYAACRIETPGDVARGRFGIREPAAHCGALAANRLDLILAPGVAFDAHGRRLGRGRGFYDRLLALASGTICGVAFDEQIVGEIPVEPHDRHVNCILTPTRWLQP